MPTIEEKKAALAAANKEIAKGHEAVESYVESVAQAAVALWDLCNGANRAAHLRTGQTHEAYNLSRTLTAELGGETPRLPREADMFAAIRARVNELAGKDRGGFGGEFVMKAVNLMLGS